MNLFKKATKNQWRFPTTVGMVGVEDLWAMPLTASRGNEVSVDNVAKTLHVEIVKLDEESFVKPTGNGQKKALEEKLELVKEIIADRLAEREAATKRAATTERNRKIDEIIARKRDQALEDMSIEDLENMKNS